MGPNKRPGLYAIAVSAAGAVPLALAHLGATATLCPDRVRPGAFGPDGVVLFYVPGVSNVSSSSVAAEVFSHPNLRMQERVAVLQRLSARRRRGFLSWRFNPFGAKMERSLVELGDDEGGDLARCLFRPYDMDVRV